MVAAQIFNKTRGNAIKSVYGAVTTGTNCKFMRLTEAGFIRPVVGARFPLERASEALVLIDERGATGKVVLDVA